MSNLISLTVPGDDEKALVAGATMLLTLAGKVPEMELVDARDNTGVTFIDDFNDAETTTPPPEATTTPPPAETTTPPPEATTTPPPAAGVELRGGIPWDARIHAGTKATLADGTWRYKQGVDRAVLVPQVEAELHTLMGDATTTPPPPETTTPPPAATTTPPPAATDAPTTFPEFLKAVSGLISSGATTMVAVTAVLNEPQFGIASIQLVNSRPDLIPAIWAALVSGGE